IHSYFVYSSLTEFYTLSLHDALPIFMEEQLYSASGKVNDILRAYFPEQFGERHFLDYPIGHFFVSTTNMWNDEAKSVRIEGFSRSEEHTSELQSRFDLVCRLLLEKKK